MCTTNFQCQAELSVALQSDNLFSWVYDHDLQWLLVMPQHLPCLTHVIQLAVNAFLQELKIEAHNDDVVFQWHSDERQIKEQGLLQTLEKVCLITIKIRIRLIANIYKIYGVRFEKLFAILMQAHSAVIHLSESRKWILTTPPHSPSSLIVRLNGIPPILCCARCICWGVQLNISSQGMMMTFLNCSWQNMNGTMLSIFSSFSMTFTCGQEPYLNTLAQPYTRWVPSISNHS